MAFFLFLSLSFLFIVLLFSSNFYKLEWLYRWFGMGSVVISWFDLDEVMVRERERKSRYSLWIFWESKYMYDISLARHTKNDIFYVLFFGFFVVQICDNKDFLSLFSTINYCTICQCIIVYVKLDIELFAE